MCTHAHNDHIDAAPELAKATGAPILLHPADRVLWDMTHPISCSARMLDVDPAECVLIGDSSSDIVAAHAAGVPVIGYANKAIKVEQYVAAGADLIVTSMADIARVLIDVMPVGDGER